MPLSKRDKAALYDDLMKDVDAFVAAMEKHWQKIEDIKQEDLEIKDKDYREYMNRQLGSYQGNNFGLRLQIDYFLGKLSWFKRQGK